MYNGLRVQKTKTKMAKNENSGFSRAPSKLGRMFLVLMAFGVFQFATGLIPAIRANSVDDLQQQSEQLQEEIHDNSARAEELGEHAESLEEAVGALDSQIGKINGQIGSINGKISQLEKELEKAKKELTHQKELLKANMRALYKRGGASTVELLVASDSFSEFIDEQEYLERLKTTIQDSTEKVLALKQKIESQRDEQKELLAQQESAKKSLDDTRAQRSSLLVQTRGEESRYREQMAKLASQQREVENRINSMLMAGNFVSEGRVEAGQMVGRIGMTGFTFGPHLHFEYRSSSNQPLNPGSGSSLNHGLRWPVPGHTYVNHGYGCQSEIQYYTSCSSGGWLHAGIDIPASIGSPIVAAKSGDLQRLSGYNGGYGNMVIIKHDDGTYTRYAHLSN